MFLNCSGGVRLRLSILWIIAIHDIPYQLQKAIHPHTDAIRGRLGEPVYACYHAFLWIWATLYQRARLEHTIHIVPQENIDEVSRRPDSGWAPTRRQKD